MAAVKSEPLRVLLVKPYQSNPNFMNLPPLGLLSIISCLRQRFDREQITIRFVDAKLRQLTPLEIQADLAWADVIGLSTLNCEAEAAAESARIAKALDPKKIVAIGGPYAHRRAEEILTTVPEIDWVFDGEGEYTFGDAIEALLESRSVHGIKGLYYRHPLTGDVVAPLENDVIMDLDSLPFPAWDLVDFDAYARKTKMTEWMKGKRYAPLFTSRGCPYKCAYCHDIFTKKFRWQSPERVLAEIDHLVTNYKIDEFQIVDDIFNLHKPRAKAIFGGVVAKYGMGGLHFCFPNGLRGDILDADLIAALKEGGTYQICMAVETVTPRLQQLIDKNLKLDRVENFINLCHDYGIPVKGFFMLGFPTETPPELWNTIRFAWRSKLTFAGFFTVVPQPGTPLYALAMQESEAALRQVQEIHYYGRKSWYSMAYAYPLGLVSRIAYAGFYLNPLRIGKILRHVPPRAILEDFRQFLSIIFAFDYHRVLGGFRPRRKRHGTPASHAAARQSAQPAPGAEGGSVAAPLH